MKSIRFSLLAVLALLLFLPVAVTAQEDMNEEGNSIVQLAENNGDLTILVAALKASDLVSTLEGDGPFTVFAPTDEAFRALPDEVFQALLKAENRQTLVDILTYHVADGQLSSEDVTTAIEGTDNGEYMATTMNGDLTAMLMDATVQVRDAKGNTATVTQPDVMASNGVIHIIDAVLLPENVDVDALMAGTTEEVDERLGEVDNASGVRPPATNPTTEMQEEAVEMREAAEEMGEETEVAIDETIEQGEEMGEEMIEEGEEMAQDVTRSTQDMSSEVTDGTVATPDYSTTSSDLTRRSGNTIVDVAVDNADFSTLVTAIEAAELGDLLGGEDSEFTVFAPTNEAFDKLPEGSVSDLTQSSNKQQLQGILSYHVIPSKISAADLMKAIESHDGYFRLQTISGQSLIASLEDGNVVLTDGSGDKATITSTDVAADNGVIHVIDTVLMPKM